MKFVFKKFAIVAVVFLSACASSTEHVVKTESPAPKSLPPSQVTAEPDTAPTSATTDAGEPTIKIVPLNQQTVPSTPVTESAVAQQEKPKAADSHVTPSGVPPEQALTWLKHGNRRFVKGFFRNDGATKKDIQRLASGQKPHSIILSCSDSRVPPEVIFDQKLGEVFVVRTAGEALDSSAIASIEYAVEHLGSRNILVMGHTQCGAVKAALATLEGQDAGSANLNKLVADIHPRLAQFQSKLASKDYVDESWANTKGVAKDLVERSSIIAERVRSGDVQINTALYHLDSGKAEFSR